jgi:hypothetical protein
LVGQVEGGVNLDNGILASLRPKSDKKMLYCMVMNAVLATVKPGMFYQPVKE